MTDRELRVRQLTFGTFKSQKDEEQVFVNVDYFDSLSYLGHQSFFKKYYEVIKMLFDMPPGTILCVYPRGI